MPFAPMLVTAVLAFGACSDGTSASSGTPAVETTSITYPSSTAEPSTTTTSKASTSTTTTTTMPPAAVAEAAARSAVDSAIGAFRSCLAALPSCDVNSLAETRAGTMLERNTARITEWNAAGYALREGDDFRYVIEQVQLGPELNQATVTVCSSDGSQLVLPGAGPGGADVVIDESYASGRAAWDVRADADGRWRVHAAPAIGPTESRDICPES